MRMNKILVSFLLILLACSCSNKRSSTGGFGSGGGGGGGSDAYSPGGQCNLEQAGSCALGVGCADIWTADIRLAGNTSWDTANDFDIAGPAPYNNGTPAEVRDSALKTDYRLKIRIKLLPPDQVSTCYKATRTAPQQNQNTGRKPPYEKAKFILQVFANSGSPFYSRVITLRQDACSMIYDIPKPLGLSTVAYRVKLIPYGTDFACKFWHKVPDADTSTDARKQCPTEEPIPSSVCWGAKIAIVNDTTYDFPPGLTDTSN